jgi:MFS-type transporter involved in bile tolerance (Atg22 family)
MAAGLAMGSANKGILLGVFALAGTFTGVVEALEDSLTASIVPKAQRGMAYGSLAAVNSAGDFLSSIFVGALWTVVSPSAAFATAGVLFLMAAVLILRLKEQRIDS